MTAKNGRPGTEARPVEHSTFGGVEGHRIETETKPQFLLTVVREDWLDFLEPEGLSRRAGVPRAEFRRALVKELCDNGSDVAATGILIDAGNSWLSITDDGPGVDASLFTIRRPLTSSKLWRRADRGALGNGLRVVMGVVAIEGGTIRVESFGRHLALTVGIDGETVIEDRGASDIVTGTRVTVEIDGIEALVEFARDLASTPGRAYDGPPYAGWFDADAIRSLLRAAPGLTVADLAGAFPSRACATTAARRSTRTQPT